MNFWQNLFGMKPKVYRGQVESIELTFGSKGQQIMTIDGVRFATWIDYKKWPKIGSFVEHTPLKKYGMLSTEIVKYDA